jgi:hypothetical protein
MKAIIFILSFLFLPLSLFAQSMIQGNVTDAETGQPLPFVNIGLVSRNIGTVSSDEGNYTLKIDSGKPDDKLRFSYIGYEPQTFLLKDFQKLKSQDLKLRKAQVELKEVTVKSAKAKTKILGNVCTSKLFNAGFNSNDLGSEFAVKVPFRNKTGWVKQVSFQINSNEYEDVIFRFNVYSADASGKPGESLLKQNIIIKPDKKTGMVTFDLADHNIIPSGDFFIALEWIKDLGKSGLYFSAGLLNGGTYFRKTSHGEWEHISSVGMGLNATVVY